MSTIETKRCKRCDRTLPLSEFWKRAATKGGVNHRCVACCKEVVRPEDRKAALDRYFEKYPHKRAEARRRAAAAKAKKEFGLTLEEYEARMAAAKQCDICEEEFDPARKGSKHLDHCHTTRRIRGVLCNKCNLSIGLMRDNPKFFRAAASYLEYV